MSQGSCAPLIFHFSELFTPETTSPSRFDTCRVLTPPGDIPTGSWLLGGHLTAYGDNDDSDPQPPKRAIRRPQAQSGSWVSNGPSTGAKSVLALGGRGTLR